MTVTYFEGFDQHQNGIMSGLDAGGDQDTGKYWGQSTFYRHSYTTDTVDATGRALIVDEFIQSHDVLSGSHVRIGWTGKVLAHIGEFDAGSADSDFFALYDNFGHEYRLQMSKHDATLTMYINGVVINTNLAGPSVNTWEQFEMNIDTTTGTFEYRKEGVLIQTGTGGSLMTTADPAYLVQFGRNQPGLAISRYWCMVDNFYVTDGAAVAVTTSEDPLCVSVNATIDNFTGSNGFVEGHIDYGADPVTQWYSQTPGQDSVTPSQSYTLNSNMACVASWFWTTDPRDSSAWTAAKFNAITSFGVCLISNANGLPFRLVCVTLNKLISNFGRPRVKTILPSGETAFSNSSVWTKSDTTKTYAALVRTVPRKVATDYHNSDYLTVSVPGCIAFGVGATNGDTTATVPFGYIGLTFAEEYRTDYLDWVKVGGTGVDYTSFFKAGYMLPGSADHRFQDNYVTVNYENLSGGQAYIQGLWDYALDASTGRWSMRQNIYAEPYAGEQFKHAPRKIKVRGRGRSLQLYVTSKDNAPFRINGWSIVVLINQGV